MNRYIVLIILLLGFILPMIGISFGLPDLFKFDEITYVEAALRFGDKFDFNPHCFVHGTLLNYVLFFAYAPIYMILFLFRLVASPEDFLIKYYIANPSLLFLVGRIMQVLFGVGTIAATYLIGKILFNKRAGLISAYLLSVSFVWVQRCHYIKADILASFLLTLAFLFTAEVFMLRQPISKAGDTRANDTKFLMLSGLFIGLAISAKYLAILGYIFLVALQILTNSNKKHHRKFFFATLMIAVGFLIGEPYALLAKNEFIEGILRIPSVPIDYFGRAAGQSKLLFYFGDMLKNSIGLPVLICSFSSIYLLKKRNLSKKILLLLSFPVAFSILIISSPAVVDRYLPPIVPFLAMLSAATIDNFLNSSSRYNKKIAEGNNLNLQFSQWYRLHTFLYHKKNLLLIAIMVLMSLPLANVIRFSILIASEDTRITAKAWIENNIPANSSILIESAASGEAYAVEQVGLKPNLETLLEDYNRVIAHGGKGRLVRLRIKHLKDNQGQITYKLLKKTVITSETVNSLNPDYIIFSSYFELWAGSKNRWSGSEDRRLLRKEIEGRYEKIKMFLPFPGSRWDYNYQMDYDMLKKMELFSRNQKIISGPTLYIYKRKAL